jgi:integrase
MHKDRDREVTIGPRAQEVLAPFLDRPADQPCFSPAEAAAAVRQSRHAKRVTPAGYGNTIGTNRRRKPVRTPGDRYDVASYRRAIWRACEQAFAMPKELRTVSAGTSQAAELRRQAAAWREKHCWAPNQLRHTAGTAIRKAMGLEAAQAILGHSRLDVTQVYAEKSSSLAREAALRLG